MKADQLPAHIDAAYADLSSATVLHRKRRFARSGELLRRASAELAEAARIVSQRATPTRRRRPK